MPSKQKILIVDDDANISELICLYLNKEGFETAQVTAGGLDCSGFDRHTMESKLVPGVYCTGETLNVDGDCGGFNLMFAFATGILAGKNGR